MENFEARCGAIVSAKGSAPEAKRLHQLFELEWEYRMNEFPEFATWYGYPGQNHRWTDNSLEAIERRKGDLKTKRRVLDSINRVDLEEPEQLNFDLFARELDEAIEGSRFHGELMPIGASGGPHTGPPQSIALMPAQKTQDFDNILARLEGVPLLLERAVGLLTEGVASGVTQPKIILRNTLEQINSQIVDDPSQSPMLQPFQKEPEGFAEGFDDYSRVAKKLYEERIKPALIKYRGFVSDTYIPGCRDLIALGDVPDGEDWYAFLVRRFTTTGLSPKDVHEIGLSEVERIRSEMDVVIKSSGFQGTFEQFTEFLRTDPQFYFESAEDLLTEYRSICKRVDPELARLFGRLPRLPYGVKPVPSYSEKSAPTAYYQIGSPEVGRAGYFFANTYDLKARPKWEMEALTLHEAVPGHHLQFAVAQELEGMPEFRKRALITAYIEGWALYAESLGPAMGFYQDPYSRFGQLTYEMWRAVRLVVDTGMHALGWTREQAIEFFTNNTGKTEHDIITEVDRYIGWPGQALAYKIGELKIKELRAYGEEMLGSSFDVRAFHDKLLGDGPLPLEILENRVKEWLSLPQP